MQNNEFEVFVQELNGLFGEERPPRVFLDSAADLLRKLASGSFYLDLRRLRPTKSSPVRHLVFDDPKGNYKLLAVAWPSGYSTPVHDHGTWGVLVGYRARTVVTTWRRADDGSEKGRAKLHEVSRQLLTEGGVVALVRPPEEEVHKVENPFRDTSITVHLVGEDKPWPNIYSPSDGTLTPAGGAEHYD